MSLLNQFPVAPKRGRVIPGNDGYELGIEPGFKYDQQIYRFSHTVKRCISNRPNVTTVDVNYPNIKLGSNQYRLDMERVDVTTYLDPAFAGDGSSDTKGPLNSGISNTGPYYGEKDMRGIFHRQGLLLSVDGPWDALANNIISKEGVFAMPWMTERTRFNNTTPGSSIYTGPTLYPKMYPDTAAMCFYTPSSTLNTQCVSGYRLNVDTLQFTLTIRDNGFIFQDLAHLPSTAKIAMDAGSVEYDPASKLFSDVTYNFVVRPSMHTDSML